MDLHHEPPPSQSGVQTDYTMGLLAGQVHCLSATTPKMVSQP